VNVALVMLVPVDSTKSSADSISKGAPVSGRVAVAIKPSGLPVLKNGAAAAGCALARASNAIAAEAALTGSCISFPLIFPAP
jgi:hypothetical protein